MGMVLSLCSLSDANIVRVLEDPPLVWQVVAPEDPEMYQRARERGQELGLIARLLRRKPSPVPLAADLVLADGEGEGSDLDKAWHGIHYLLTRTASAGAPPLDFLVAGGRAVGAEDLGYGPARAFTSGEVQSIDTALRGVPEAELRRRFDPPDMLAKEIYPAMWDRPPAQQDTLGYLLEYVGTLKEFVESTARRQLGLVIYLS